MSTTFQRSPASRASERQSPFFRDLASPISAHRVSSRFATPGQAAAVSALWRENFGAASDNPPPPPCFTLEDRVDFSPEPALLHEVPPSPETPTPPRRSYFASLSPAAEGGGGGGSGGTGAGLDRSPGSGGWWAPRGAERGSEEKGAAGQGSPVEGVVKSSGAAGQLIMLPPPREVARPEMRKSQIVPAATDRVMDEEEWVTVYGFSPGDTNLVLREFEKCGVIVRHVPGPRDANWMHILYQSRYDAQKALGKNGLQLNSVLIVGVKPIDPVQRQYLNERLNNTHGGFMVSLPTPSTTGRTAAPRPVAASPGSHFLQNGGGVNKDGGRRPTGAIASPAKSVVSKVIDLMFGF